ncbi:ATP-binding cassette domain-containing protein [Streptomyces sp. NPDC057287]|uniref:ATP-binding cassette domain-containing protein n=1 Tax=Streptomyces sp. NPDC057287 TaxID=3346086 RepID=UPI003643D3C2
MAQMRADIGAETAARAADLHREYGRGTATVRALRGVSVALAPRTFTAVMGPSGSGTTTLLHCLAGMDRPTRGSVWWGGTEVSRLPERRLAELRRRHRRPVRSPPGEGRLADRSGWGGLSARRRRLSRSGRPSCRWRPSARCAA